jgi:hypothetical protein
VKPTPIIEVLRRIRPLPPVHKAAHLRALISQQPKRSLRRAELERALKEVVNKQLGVENRQDRRKSA